MSGWAKDIVKWQHNGRWHLSVPFTWLLPEVAGFCLRHGDCIVGGPAAKLMPSYIADYAEVGEEDLDFVLPMHNPDATRTTLGCDEGCPFCGVYQIEGPFRELDHWQPKPIVIDSNFLACSDRHFDRVCDVLQPLSGIDFNQGLTADLFCGYRAERIAALRLKSLHFAWDLPQNENAALTAVNTALDLGVDRRKIVVLCLVGWREYPEEALYRMMTLRDLGVWGFPMRYQPLDALRKNDYWPVQWKSRDLRWFVHFWSRQGWFGGAQFRWPSHGPQYALPLSGE